MHYPGSKLHQIGPYIGKIRPSLARDLVTRYTRKGECIWDPFCGSGTIPLEGKLLGRYVIASDTNPYACALTRAKLHAPISIETCYAQLEKATEEAKKRLHHVVFRVPMWVKDFFNQRTLKETLTLMQVLHEKKLYFNIGCLLGILHHQRPGFLSYPASHLVPYLRDRKYPRHLYPEKYEYRDPIPRLKAKIKRVMEIPPKCLTSRFRVFQKSALTRYLRASQVDAVITSPPYMNALDYARDNRLRLWFLGIDDYRTVKAAEIRTVVSFEQGIFKWLQIVSEVIKPGGYCILIIGDLVRHNKRYDIPGLIQDFVTCGIKVFDLCEHWSENIPDHRRSRKSGQATKKEIVLVYKRKREGRYG